MGAVRLLHKHSLLSFLRYFQLFLLECLVIDGLLSFFLHSRKGARNKQRLHFELKLRSIMI